MRYDGQAWSGGSGRVHKVRILAKVRPVASRAVVTFPGHPLEKSDANPIGVEAIHVSRPGIYP